jgi:hypothetical protein
VADRSVSINLRAKVSGFIAGMGQAKKSTEDLGRKMTETGAHAAEFRRRLEAATKALPKIEIDADSTPAEIEFAKLRSQMERLTEKRIGIDIDAGAARAELAQIERDLSKLQRSNANISVNADIGTALTELRAIDGEISKVDGRTAKVNVNADVAGALAGIAAVGAALAALPAALTIGVGVSALGSSFAAAGIGAAAFSAVAVPSFGRVTEALKASETAAAGAGAATGGAGKSAAQAAGEVLQLEQAQKRLKDAQADAQQAQRDLTSAWDDGRRSLQDLNFSLDRSILSQKDAALAVREAAQRLAEVQADPEADSLDRERAELSYQQALQRSEEQQVKTTRAIKDTAEANRAGIKGTQEYQRAQEDVVSAQDKVAQAEAQLKQLRLQQAAAMSSAGGAAGGLKDAFADLSKEERVLVKDLKAFKDGYVDWQRALQPDVLPAISQGLKVMSTGLDLVGPGAAGAGRALTGLGKDAEKALRGPFWQDFFDDVNAEIPNAITRLGHTGGNVFEGFAGVIQALLPYGRDLLGNVEDISEKFATWGTGLGTDSNFHQFMAYVQANGPAIWETLKNVAETGGNIVEALAPFGVGSLGGLSLLAKLTADMDPGHIQGIAIAVAAVYGAVKTGQAISAGVEALGVLRSRLDGTGTAAGSAKTKLGSMAGALAAGGPWGLAIGAGIGALGLFASSHFEAEQRVGDLTQAIKADSGALGENTRAKVANTLQTSGAMETARKYGISMATLTDAALGNQGALSKVNTQLANQGSQALGLRPAVRSLSDANKVLTGDTLELWKQLNSTNGEVGEARQAAQNLAEAMGPTAIKTGDLATAQGSLSGKAIEARDAFLKQLPKLMELAGGNQKAKDEVLKLAEAYGISAEDAEKAAKGGKDLRDVLAELKSKEIRIFVKTEFQDELSRDALRQASKRAEGGIYDTAGTQYMAQGGIRSAGSSPQAMIAKSPYMISGRNGPDVVFGEAGAEVYIPLSTGKRARGLQILQEAAGIMGMAVVPEKIGVNTAGGSTTGGGGSPFREASVTVTGIDSLRSSLNTTALSLTNSLGGATSTLDATLGDAGSLTSSLDGVGEIAGHLAGEVTGWGEVISVQVPPLTEAVTALGAAVSAAAAAADAKGDSGSKADEQNPRSGSAKGKVAGGGYSSARLTGIDDMMAKETAAAETKIQISGVATGSAGVVMSGGTNWSRTSKPVQSSYSSSPSGSSASGATPSASSASAGSPGGGAPMVQVQSMQVREQADIDMVAERLYFKATSRG